VKTGEFFAEGLPVAIGSIDKALGRLWEESGDSKTRASLMNLVVVTGDRNSIPQNTALIASLAGEHACRAILVLVEPEADCPEPRAWISAHCHAGARGGKEICSEQITFHLPGSAADGLPGIVFSHLDSDLPLVLWWQTRPPENADPDLWRWVDRLIFDSADWADAGECLDRIRRIATCRDTRGNPRKLSLCDLNWARLLDARFAFASLFDRQVAQGEIPRMTHATLRHSPGCKTVALLFLGWIASQLDWTLQPLLSANVFANRHGREIPFSLEEIDAPGGLLLCELRSGNAKFSLIREEGKNHYVLQAEGRDGLNVTRTFPADSTAVEHILLGELSRGGEHPGYFRTLDIIRPLL
jgi:glucose-6-phosphate dehydrogenase assembly protein OpcA